MMNYEVCLGLSGRDLEAHQKPVLPLAKRREIAVGEQEQVCESMINYAAALLLFV